ncbi:restriction endonuclease subunit S [Mycoplasmopsis felis]|uniref:restriction endonuclease subunit S n=1 Tax=Mycoplasmopsis felis TaxID=33923 RepID=UPI002AFE9380|nr:restriction endonuclease subunit S [Mycoplasmopsis felis]WQQ05896.1 restriction endonuclease subunit S [Mycoplasmopsis felis]
MFEKIKTNNIYKNVEPGDLPATTALLTNNQIGRYVNRKNATILKNVFSATANGTGRAFYQPYDFTVLQDSYAFKFKDKKINIKNIHPFIVCVLNIVYAKYDWGNKSGWEKVKNDFIKLPTKNNQIDFDFMEKYISLIKQESLNKLKKEYLNKQTNNNYSLSTLEQDAINKFNDITWKEYRIGDLFDVNNDWIYGKNKNWLSRFDKEVKNSLPVISGITINNGVNYWTKDLPSNNEIFSDSLTISTRGEYSGTVTYHKHNFLLANNILVMHMKDYNFSQKLFMGTIISKLPYGGYNGYPRKETLKNNIIKLPTKNNQIDFNFIENFINAIQKLILKNIYIWIQSQINNK